MKRFALLLLLSIALFGACGSGGGSSGAGPTTVPSTAVPPSSTATPATTSGSAPTTAVSTTVGGAAQPVTLAWVSMDSGQSGWGASDAGQIVRTEDGGATWHPAGPPAATGPDAVIYTDGAFSWIATPSASGVSVWHTDTAGETWKLTEVPRDPEAGVFVPHDLVFPDPANGWLLLQLDGAAGTVFVDLYATTDSGDTWTKVAGPPPNDTNSALESGHSLDMDFNSSGRGWVTKDIGAAAGAHIAATADGGATWRDVTIPELESTFCATRDPYARDVVGGSVLIECADESAWFAQTPDDGETWELFAMPEPAVQAFRFEDGAFAWGDTLMEWLGPPEEFQVIYRFPARPASVSIPDAVHVFAVIEGALWRSDDQGRSWKMIETTLTAP